MYRDDEGITLMELLPPVGWADVATKQDLAALQEVMEARFEAMDHKFETLEHRMDARLERSLRTMLLAMMSLFVADYVATILAVALC